MTPKDTRRGVMQIMWHLTERCNLSCEHCYSQSSFGAELSFKDLIQIADNIRDLHKTYNVVRVGLLGGEPLLREDLFDIAKYLFNVGLSRIDIATNGTLISERLIPKIKEARISSIQISIEGGTPEINDRIRGTGVFQKILNAITLLKENEIPVYLLVTISKRNFSEMDKIIELALKSEVEIVSFNRYLPLGQSRNKMGDEYLTPQQLRDMLNYIHNVNKQNLNLWVTSDDPMLHGLYPKFSVQKGGCGAGIGNLAILPDGTVYPCRRLPIPVGNALISSLSDIMLNNHLLKLLRHRDMLKGACKLCKFRNTCGGCRASAYLFRYSVMESDPMCFLTDEEMSFNNV